MEQQIESRSQAEEEELGKLAVRLANAAVLPMVLKSALELNVIDIIVASDDAFLSPLEIAGQLPTKNPKAPVLLDRVLRLLASYSILKCSIQTDENGNAQRLYSAGAICKFLIKNVDGGSLAPMLLLLHSKDIIDTWYTNSFALLSTHK